VGLDKDTTFSYFQQILKNFVPSTKLVGYNQYVGTKRVKGPKVRRLILLNLLLTGFVMHGILFEFFAPANWVIVWIKRYIMSNLL
jgi:hypothetical protein